MVATPNLFSNPFSFLVRRPVAISVATICTCISSWQSYPNNSNHKRANTQPNTTLSRPIPRSGWRVSLRRVPFA